MREVDLAATDEQPTRRVKECMSERGSTCPVCGYQHLSQPPYDGHGCASFDICPCCGTEFGYDDSSATHEVLRRRWIGATGEEGSGPVRRPRVR